ncbi:TrkH family potassium uptake protein [Enterococcus sp. HY326]|uniref:TrkH family potassium uptake protein n=1 Tax=Enterococcus sp. HY326 TaxID=2971265 RepID=UPI00223F07C0|nr:TrkH family potassium uptake protein [Enterococcus sp. HY326]
MFKVKKRMFEKISPGRLLALGFLFLILIGGSLLSLPFFSRSGEATAWLDGIFTATSAVCVTGLTTLNTAEQWNIYGQVLIMVLIEIGGLGFMMIPILFFSAMKKKVAFSTRIVLQEALNLDDLSGVMKLMLYIVKLSAVIQGVGAVLLSFVFVPQYGWLKGIWFGIFHSISSFCNAGFDLLGDSLAQDQQNWFLILVVALLIIAGGLGFIVWRDIIEYREKKRLSLHTRIGLSITGILLIGGTILFFFTENNAAALAPNGNFFERLVNTFFMSVTPRTAGYYSVNYAHMTDAGLILTMFLMYIGGTSGSTAGGLKTTTFGVLLIQMRSMFKGRTRAEFHGRTIRQSTVLRALTLFFITLTVCVLAIMLLSVTETIPPEFGIEYIAFEAFSAFGTVGLTMGLTPDLTEIGKVVIIALMYIGRVGILTVVFSLIAKSKREQANFKYPEEGVMVG